MRKFALLILLTVLLSSSGQSQPQYLDKFKSRLDKLESYSFSFETEVYFRPDMKPTVVTGTIKGKRPNLMALDAELSQGSSTIKTLMLFDGRWQWVDAKQSQGFSQGRKIIKIDQKIARPGAPFDTFYYFSGSGFFSGEDYLGTFESVLELYDFENFHNVDGQLFAKGSLIEEKYKEFAAERDQRAISEILYLDDSLASCKLYLDPLTFLPIGLDLGPKPSEPQVKMRAKLLAENSLHKSDFLYTPPDGWAVYDATAQVAESRAKAAKVKPGSDFFELVSTFIQSSDEMKQEVAEALDARDANKLLELLKADPSQLESKDILGSTPLTYVAGWDDPQVLTQLLKLGADPSRAGYGRKTPLHVAVRSGNTEIAKILLSEGADLEARDAEGNSPLHLATDPQVTELLLEAGAKESVYNNYGNRPPVVEERGAFFLKATREGNMKQLDRFLARGMKVEQKYKNQWGIKFSPLEVAAAVNPETLRYLVDKLKLKGSARNEVLTEALPSSGSPEVVRFLVAQGANAKKVNLLEGLSPGSLDGLSPEILSELLRLGADPNQSNEKGQTPLVLYLYNIVREVPDLEPAKKLIAAGNDIDQRFDFPAQKENLGRLALVHLAATEPKALQALEELGADLELRTETGWTAFHMAATYNSVPGLEFLADKGANITTQEDNGWTPLHSAVFLYKRDAVKFLLSRQKDLNIVDKVGNTALHLAAHLGRKDLIKVLVAKGADPSIKNEDGEKASDLSQDPEVKKMLK